MGSAKPNSVCLKTNSVRFVDNGYDDGIVVNTISDEVGLENIWGCVKSAGQWIVTLKNSEDAQLLQEIGIKVGNDMCLVSGVLKSLITVSLFGVPVYITDYELTVKLLEFGCTLKSKWIRKHYKQFPAVENGIRYVRVELPNNVKSLPYAIIVGGVHLRMKHNGQTRVCNRCLSDSHIMKDCPEYICRNCGIQGHSESRCPEVKCYKCQRYGHKSFLCPEKDVDDDERTSSQKPGRQSKEAMIENIEIDEAPIDDGGGIKNEMGNEKSLRFKGTPSTSALSDTLPHTSKTTSNDTEPNHSRPEKPPKPDNVTRRNMTPMNKADSTDMVRNKPVGLPSKLTLKPDKGNEKTLAAPKKVEKSPPVKCSSPPSRPSRQSAAQSSGQVKRTVSSDDEAALAKYQRSSSIPRSSKVTPNLDVARNFTPRGSPSSSK